MPRKINLIPLGVVISTALIGAVALSVGVSLWISSARKAPFARLSPNVTSIKDEALIEDSLIGSVLSIIKHYYVDSGRTDLRQFARTALRVLARNHKITFEDRQEELVVKISGQTFALPLPLNPSLKQTVAVLDDLTTLAQRYDLLPDHTQNSETPADTASTLLNIALRELDAHSALLSKSEYEELRQGTEGSFGGLGVLVGMRDQVLTVLKPIPGSPAHRAGLRKNDRILTINGTDTFGRSLDQLIEHMRGDPGSTVILTLLRDGATAPFHIQLNREIVQVNSVTTHHVRHGPFDFLHLTIDTFAARTAKEVKKSIEDFRRTHHGRLNGLILDLRSNPGGLLDQAVEVADLFLAKGAIVSTKGRREEVEQATPDPKPQDFPIVTLINEDSASASEIVAGALQDHRRAVTIGQPSFGKGSVQTVFELAHSRALKLTIARYYTPSGGSIQNRGIMPDLWLQPVFSKQENLNLLGHLRYANERFLPHHLEADQDWGDASPRPSAWKKIYYLAKVADPLQITAPEDHELNMALSILNKTLSVYKGPIPEEGMRATHWLSLAGPDLEKVAKDLGTKLTRWMVKNHRIVWDPSVITPTERGLLIEVDDLAPNEAGSGTSIPIKVKVKNRTSRALTRLSIYARSDTPLFETQEILLGTLNQGETRTQVFTIKIPPQTPEGSLLVDFGIAMDAEVLSFARAEHLIQVRRNPLAILDSIVTLNQEEGGHISDTLESAEQAQLLIQVKNQGTVPATGLRLSLVNLSGNQVRLRDPSHSIPKIGAGEIATWQVKVGASRHLVSHSLQFGLHVEGEDVRDPLVKMITIRSQPHRTMSSKEVPTIGH